MTSKRDIVLFLDGTGNTTTRFDTNVIRLYRMAKEVHPSNLLYYDPGIGTLPKPGRFSLVRSWAGRLFGSASGQGMIENVAEAYEFLCNQYEDGDAIWIFGFSRGSYTARLLASVIHQCGLLPKGARHLTPYAINLALAGPEDQAQAFGDKLLLVRPKVTFLGLFDCVRSAILAVDAPWNPIQFQVPYSWYNPSVDSIRHAMAIDEFRAMFPVNRWAEKHTCENVNLEDQNIDQVWFPGNHCDVGGSNSENGLDLSVVPLRWMRNEAVKAGLNLGSLSGEQEQLATDYNRLARERCNDESMRPFWLGFELLPTYSANNDDRPRFVFPHARRRRHIPYQDGFNARIHESVQTRIKRGRCASGKPYAPSTIPKNAKHIDWVH